MFPGVFRRPSSGMFPPSLTHLVLRTCFVSMTFALIWNATLATASEEAEQACEALPGYEHASFFLAHAARLADAAGDADRAQTLAARTLAMDPDLPRRHREGARELLAAGENDSARELLVAAKVVAPRDLETLDLLRQLES